MSEAEIPGQVEFPPSDRVNLFGSLSRGELVGAGVGCAIFGLGAMSGKLLEAGFVLAVIVIWTFLPNRRRPFRITVPDAARWHLRRERKWAAPLHGEPTKLPTFLRGVDIRLGNTAADTPAAVVVKGHSYTTMFRCDRAALTYVPESDRDQVMGSWAAALGAMCVERGTEIAPTRVGWTDLHRASDPEKLERYHRAHGVDGPATNDYRDYLTKFETLGAEHEIVVWVSTTRQRALKIARKQGMRGRPNDIMTKVALNLGETFREDLAGRGFETSALLTPAEVGRVVSTALDPFRPVEQRSNRERFGLVDRFGPQSQMEVHRDKVIVDRAYHRVFSLDFPTSPVASTWLWEPLAVPGPKVVSMVFEPVPPSQADRERDSKRSIGARNNQAAASEGDGHVKEKNRRKVRALTRTEKLVADGHQELDAYALLLVSGTSEQHLDENCQALRRAVRQTGRGNIRELSGLHDEALAAALPLGVPVGADTR